MDWIINQENHVRLPRVDEESRCFKCGKVLACRYQDSILVKSYVLVWNRKNNHFILRCGGCKHFSQMDHEGKVTPKIMI